MSKDRTWFLVGKKLAGEASADELNELEGLLRSDPDMHYALQNITDLWNLSAPPNHDIEAAFDRHVARLQHTGVEWGHQNDPELQQDHHSIHKTSRKKLLIISVAVALLMLASLYWHNSVTNAPANAKPVAARTAEKNEVSTRNGSKTTITLPDGSKVWLNAGSTLTYNKDFGGDRREVELRGEAFFEVVPVNSKTTVQKIPFIIHTQHIDIRVLGTAFNVKSYPGDQQTETSLVRGKVEVLIHNRPDEKFTLRPNEKLVVSNEEDSTPVASKQSPHPQQPIVTLSKLSYTDADSLVVETAWVQNKLVFDNESFVAVAEKMERWYNVQIKFNDEKKEALRFTGVFKTETIQQALDYMSITAPFHYTIKGNMITIDR